MGLPEINISFAAAAESVVKRSSRGVVAVILTDNTNNDTAVKVYNKLEDVPVTAYTARSYDYFKLIFAAKPKVIAVRRGTDEDDYATALGKLKELKWNYLTVPGIEAADKAEISAWIISQRQSKHTHKAVLSGSASNNEAIINYTTDTVKSDYSATAFTASEYCARIAGILATMPLTRSCTYFVLDDITATAEVTTPGDKIDAGELVIIFDGEKYKIGRGVTSYTGTTADLKKIKIVEAMDLYYDDIKAAFENDFVGQLNNNYDNKQAFVAAVCDYHKRITGEVISPDTDSSCEIDIAAVASYLAGKNINTDGMSDEELARADTDSHLFIKSKVRFTDAMEDMTFVCDMS